MNSISSYILKRILYMIPVLFGVCFLVLILFNIVAPDPTYILLGKHATLAQVETLRAELGLNQSLLSQYYDILRQAFTLDFGDSWITKKNILSMIKEGAIPSMTISFPAFFLATIISISISLFVSFYRGKLLDKSLVIICVAMMSVSSLVYIIFGQWFLAFKLELFEISGYEVGFPYFIPYILLPVVVWIVSVVGPDVRFYRTVILDEIYQDYVRTAKAKGLSDNSILFKHVLKNALIPILTYVIIQIPFLILGALLIESFFAIPGLGSMVLNAVTNSDFPVIKAMTILSALFFMFFNLLTDILYMLVDPRIRLK